MNRSGYLAKLRSFSRNAWLYLITFALWGGLFGIQGVLLSLYLMRAGFGPEFVGWVNGLGRLVMGLFALPAGALGGRLGVRRAILAGMCLGVVGFGLLPLAEFVPQAIQPGWVLATSSLGWLGGALYVVNGRPFLMASTRGDERHHAFSVCTALIPLAGVVGSLLAGVLPAALVRTLGVSLDHPAPYRYPLFLAALLLLPGVPVLAATRPVPQPALAPAEVAPTGKQKRARVSALPYGLIVVVSLVTLLRAEVTLFSVYLDAGLQMPASWIGVLLAVGKGLAVPAILVAPLLVERWGPFRTILWGTIGLALCLLLLALVPHWAVASLGFVGITALGRIVRPAFTVYSQESVPPHARALMSGADTMAGSLSASLMSLSGGYLIAAWGFPSLFVTAAGLTAGSALILGTALRTPRGAQVCGPAAEGQLAG
jgi:MFS family permease